MGKTAYIIDSTTPLPDKLKKKAFYMFKDEPDKVGNTVPEIIVMPLYLIYKDEIEGDVSKKENEIADIEALLAKYGNKNIMTSQVSPKDFMDAYALLDKWGYSRAMVMCLPYQMSATCKSARDAADEFRGTTLNRFYTPNSIFGSAEITLALEQLIAEGSDVDFDTLTAKADRLAANSRLWLVPNDLEGLYNSGRISHLKYVAGTTLKILPLLTVGKTGEDMGRFVQVGPSFRASRESHVVNKIVDAASEYLAETDRCLAYVVNRNMDTLSELLSIEASRLPGFEGSKVPIVNDVSNVIYKIVGPAVALAVLPVEQAISYQYR